MSNPHWRAERFELPRLARALGTLALVGFSLVLSCQMGALSSAFRNDFAERNTLGQPGRQVLLLSLGVGLSLPVLLGLFVVSRKGLDAAVEILTRLATLSAPLALLFVVPGLFLSPLAHDKPLYYLVVLAVFGVALDSLVAGALVQLQQRPPGPVRRRLSALGTRLRVSRLSLPRGVPAALVVGCAAAYALFLGRYAVLHHRLIQTVTSDVGVADNVMANLLHGRFFRSPAQFGTAAGSYLTVHAEYGALLFLPIYRWRPGSETLLWLQASLAGLAALPLYLAAARRLGRAVGVWVCGAYLLVAPVHGALLVGFSWVPALSLFAFTLYFAVESQRTWLSVAALAGVLSITESGPLYAVGLGLMLIASRKNVRWGSLIAGLGLLLAAFNGFWSQHGPGASEHPPLAGAFCTLWSNPVFFLWDLARAAKVAAILHALSPLILLPLAEFACWPLLIPGLLFASAGSAFWPNVPGVYSESVVWVPGCFVALLVVLERRRAAPEGRSLLVAAMLALTVAQVSHSYAFGALLRSDGFGGEPAELFRSTAAGQARYAGLQSLVLRIPAAASVAATTYLVSHVSNRPEVYDLARPYGNPDCILLSSRESGYVRTALVTTFASHGYRLVGEAAGEFYLFSRGAETLETTQALNRLGLVGS